MNLEKIVKNIKRGLIVSSLSLLSLSTLKAFDYNDLKILSDNWLVKHFSPNDINLEAYYPMRRDEYSSFLIYDYSNHGNHCSLYADATLCEGGVLGDYLNLDGDGDSAMCSYYSIPNMNGKFSVSFWVRQENTTRDAVPVGQYSDGKGWIFYQNETYPFGFCVFDYEDYCVNSGQSLPLNDWIHVTGVSDNINTCIYLNGVLRDCDFKGRGSYLHPYTNGMWIGAFNSRDVGYPIRYFNGSIDELAIFNRPLSSEEVENLYLNNFSQPEGDLNGDYLINFKDYSIMAREEN